MKFDRRRLRSIHIGLSFLTIGCFANARVNADEIVVLESDAARASIAVAGGGLIELRFRDHDVNPLNWSVTPDLEPETDGRPHLRGHFLCLDRWGPPSQAEQQQGMPFHGEAARVVWQVNQRPEKGAATTRAAMDCRLPLAGLKVDRELSLDGTALTVREQVTNVNPRGRIFNWVQHPSIAPPFLADTTVVDSSAQQGFVQDGPLPAARATAATWPRVQIGEHSVDLRRFIDSGDDGHDVSSFIFADSAKLGWVTASNPQHGLLIGYVWKTRHYPWLNIWRYRYRGKVAARGLEFGTTGYHQPFPALVVQRQILGRALFEYIDTGETVSKSYIVFLARIPHDFDGVAKLEYQDHQLHLHERKNENPRRLVVAVKDWLD